MFATSFYLKPRPPFRLDLTVWALRRLPHNTVDRWNGRMYTRILVLGNKTIKMNITQPDEKRIRVDIHTEKNSSQSHFKKLLTPFIEKILGIRKDLQPFYALTVHDKKVGPLVTRFMGVKPPRFPSVFEALINAIACQQLSLHVGIELLNRLAKICGRGWAGDDEPLHAFPLPEDLAETDALKLRTIGFSSNKADAIITLSRNFLEAKADPEQIAIMDDGQALDFLLGLHGIGRWSAEYVMLRGLGRIHIFPGDDVGARNNLQQLLGLKQAPDYRKIRSLMLVWHPYAGFLYFHFLLNNLAMKGYL